MELNFDKEIDAILRQARSGEAAPAAGAPHLDADEIAAFAENALPEKAKMRSTAHLADCDRCRKILSNLITLEPAGETEIVHAAGEAEKSAIAAAAPIPWYRRFLQFPSLAYSLGAVIIVFAGLIGFMSLRSFDKTQNSEVSQIGETPRETKGGPFEPDTSYSDGITANSSVPAPANSNAAPVYSTNSTNSSSAPSATPGSASNVSPVKSGDGPVDAPAVTSATPQTDEVTALSRDDKPIEVDGASGAGQNPQFEDKDRNKREDATKNDAKKTQAEEQNREATTDMAAPSSTLGSSSKMRAEKPKAKKSKNANEGETTSAGGKNFRRQGGVWYDAAYDNRATVNVTRGTDEYKKLDGGLRVIVENLGGTVVIVWKSKAYRIR